MAGSTETLEQSPRECGLFPNAPNIICASVGNHGKKAEQLMMFLKLKAVAIPA
jgi:hypothetical protein